MILTLLNHISETSPFPSILSRAGRVHEEDEQNQQQNAPGDSQNENQEHRGKKVNCEMFPKTNQWEDQFMTFKWLVSMVSFGPLRIGPNGLTGLYVPVTILSGMALQVDSLNHACWKDTFVFDKVTEVFWPHFENRTLFEISPFPQKKIS